VPYEVAHERMIERAAAIAKGEAPELIWLLEHPPLYTAGTSANPADLVSPDRFEVHQTGRAQQNAAADVSVSGWFAKMAMKKKSPPLA